MVVERCGLIFDGAVWLHGIINLSLINKKAVGEQVGVLRLIFGGRFHKWLQTNKLDISLTSLIREKCFRC